MLALAILAAAAPTPPLAADEIVVIARKLRLIEVDLKASKKNGKLNLERCRINRPSGYAELDAVPCDVAQHCMIDTPASRKALQACVETGSQRRLDAIVERWRAAGEARP